MLSYKIAVDGVWVGHVRKSERGGFDWRGLWHPQDTSGHEPEFGAACAALRVAFEDTRDNRPHLLMRRGHE